MIQDIFPWFHFHIHQGASCDKHTWATLRHQYWIAGIIGIFHGLGYCQHPVHCCLLPATCRQSRGRGHRWCYPYSTISRVCDTIRPFISRTACSATALCAMSQAHEGSSNAAQLPNVHQSRPAKISFASQIPQTDF